MATLLQLLATHSALVVFSTLAIVGLLLISAIRFFLRPVISGALDPFNVQLIVFLGPALVGFLLLPFVTGTFSDSYYTILLFLGAWFLVIRASGRVGHVDLTDRMPTDFQFALLWMAIAIVFANVTVNMIIPGKIPLFTEGGVYSRFEATTNSRLLSWLNLGTTPMPGTIFAITQNHRVRKFAAIALGISIAENLLFASKGAIIAMVIVLLNAMFVAKKRNELLRYAKLRKYVLFGATCVAFMTPVYLIAIGFGKNGGATLALAVRFLAGFDQLMFTSQFDLLHGVNLGSPLHMNLFEYQFMPFFKALFSADYEYSSVGQYVMSAMTGNYIGSAATLPNSNLILEAVFTSGLYFGLVAFCIESFVFYRLRRYSMRHPVTPFNLGLVCAFLINPFGLFLSGQEWITSTAVVFFTIVIAYILAGLWRTLERLLVFQRTVTAT